MEKVGCVDQKTAQKWNPFTQNTAKSENIVSDIDRFDLLSF